MKPRSTSSHRPRSSRKTICWPESPEQTARPGANCLAVQTFEPAPGSAYPIETAARLAGVTRRTILIYCKRKFIHPLGEPSVGGYW
ncbi:MAG TPA: hypothetical protein VHI52_09720, partial [Verrucomicrobiae bacterium]|nr:hypothetical protein [Verrucomicrobiae bacterium]